MYMYGNPTGLRRTHQRGALTRSLSRAYAKRLLHPGANTSQILDVYISTIKSLRMLARRLTNCRASDH